MLKKTIKYTDYNGNEREEDFYFNLNKAELTEMNLSANGGLDKVVERIVKEQDNAKIVAMFKDLILKSYGKKTDDGKRFMKSAEISEEFVQTEAYSNLFMELATDANAAAAFVNGILPADVAAKVKDQQVIPAPAN